MALAGDGDEDARSVVAVVELPAHPELVGDRADRGAPRLDAGVCLVGEVDAHEEDALVGVAELLAVDDVAAAVGDDARHRVDDPAPVRAREGQDQLIGAHGRLRGA
jgi:hypothetical protein